LALGFTCGAMDIKGPPPPLLGAPAPVCRR